jgi:hypothetical protein
VLVVVVGGQKTSLPIGLSFRNPQS